MVPILAVATVMLNNRHEDVLLTLCNDDEYILLLKLPFSASSNITNKIYFIQKVQKEFRRKKLIFKLLWGYIILSSKVMIILQILKCEIKKPILCL